MSNERKELIANFLSEHGVRYPILRIEGDTFEQTLGANGYPSAFLVNPKGDVVWSGHPAELEESDIVRHLSGAKPPRLKLPASFTSLQPLYDQGAFGLVHRELKALIDAGLPEDDLAVAKRVIAAIEQESRGLEEAAFAAAEKRDYPEACALLERLVGQFDGVRDLATAKQKQKELLGDAKVRKEIEGWAKLDAARKLEAAHDYRKASAAYGAIRRTYAKTRAAYEAEMAELRIKHKGLLNFDRGCADCLEAGKPCAKHDKKR